VVEQAIFLAQSKICRYLFYLSGFYNYVSEDLDQL